MHQKPQCRIGGTLDSHGLAELARVLAEVKPDIASDWLDWSKPQFAPVGVDTDFYFLHLNDCAHGKTPLSAVFQAPLQNDTADLFAPVLRRAEELGLAWCTFDPARFDADEGHWQDAVLTVGGAGLGFTGKCPVNVDGLPILYVDEALQPGSELEMTANRYRAMAYQFFPPLALLDGA